MSRAPRCIVSPLSLPVIVTVVIKTPLIVPDVGGGGGAGGHSNSFIVFVVVSVPVPVPYATVCVV